MKYKKHLLLIVISVLMVLVACGSKDETDKPTEEEALANLTDTEMPIVKEPITLKVFAGKSAQNADSDWNDILIWNEYAKMTNINIEWDQIQPDSVVEKRNLALMGGTLPDVFLLSAIIQYRYF